MNPEKAREEALKAAHRIGLNSDKADDAGQAAAIKAWQFEDRAKTRSLPKMIAWTSAVDQIRCDNRAERSYVRQTLIPSASSIDNAFSKSQPDKEVEFILMVREINELIDCLPPLYAKIMREMVVFGRPQDPKDRTTNLNKARKALKKLMKARGLNWHV